MMELKPGVSIDLTSGSSVRVIKELGRGGQGIVYLVEMDGRQMALKWYLRPMGKDFYAQLGKNIENGTPSEAFIWPKYLTRERKEGKSVYFGYVMDLRPDGYYEFGSSFLLAKKKFGSIDAMMAAAMRICEGFEKLHLAGYSYQDLNDGNFFINPETGDVLICDNDNVVPQGQQSGIMGKSRYMAPEVMLGGKPDKYSDRYSLSVILFMLFFMGHPMEGQRISECPCMTESFEKKFYGKEAVFIYDPVNTMNRPVRGAHPNVIKRWPLFPDVLKEAFIQEFSQNKLKDKKQRITEQEWRRIITRTRDCIVRCPKCGNETFASAGGCTCLECRATVDGSRYVRIKDRVLVLTPGTVHYVDSDNEPDIRVILDTNDKSRMLIQNMMSRNWSAETPSGKIKIVEPRGIVPVINGIKITFPSNDKGEIIA